ncbi:hypothetical protein Nepgr_011209 [Nepenthes gracilis]|uniref:Protein SPIRAL1-like 5 n=1 Tax=Nepenthes gracilis TaxID=150966 RepID=A0AAD3SDW3_NEPGR|nr:hypothetical protein Nepgr_011209 [Nepenthes gracilis]
MSRGESFGGGRSSLGYLFGGADSNPSNNLPLPPPSALPDNNTPPHVGGTEVENQPANPNPPVQKISNSNNYHRIYGQNLESFIIDRPSTRVKSAPGGSSSLGYLFEDN